jgi:hypothetical protein
MNLTVTKTCTLFRTTRNCLCLLGTAWRWNTLPGSNHTACNHLRWHGTPVSTDKTFSLPGTACTPLYELSGNKGNAMDCPRFPGILYVCDSCVLRASAKDSIVGVFIAMRMLKAVKTVGVF